MATVLILLLVGAVLLFLETILPGMIAGLVGLGCILAALVLAYNRFELRTANLVLLSVIVGLLAGTAAYFKYFPDSPVAKRFISGGRVGDIGTDRPELIGQTGTALTALRPSGTAMIQGKRVDVVTEGPLIARGTPVKVVAVEGMRVVVRETT